MKTKLVLILLFSIAFQNLSAQNWECATADEPNQNQSHSATTGCNYQSDTWLDTYRTPGDWIPDENTPIKTILINLVICQDDNGGNAWQDTPEFRTEVDQLFALVNETYSDIPEKGYWLTCEPTIDYITDSRIRFELNKIIFIQDSNMNQATSPISALNYVKQHYPDDYRKAMSHVFSGLPPSGYWGYFSSYDNGHHVFTRDGMIGDGPLHEDYLGGLIHHFAHEYGHAVGQHHTYNSEYTEIAHYDFLDDVFGLCAETAYCGFASNTHICYLERDFFEEGNNGGPFPLPYPLMSPSDYHYISPKSAGRMHRALSHYNYTFKVFNRYMHNYVKEKYSYATPKYITQNETWDFAIKMYQDIVIETGNTLTVSCEVKMPIDGKIFVEPGAKLIVDGGTISSAHTERWEGIQVLGNKNLAQTESNQGVIEVIQGGTIEHAEYGIYAGNKESGFQTENGGIVKIDNALFQDNIHGIYIPQYRTDENQSYIKNSSFVTTSSFFDNGNTTSPHPFITLWDVGIIDIEGNTFENENEFGFNNSPIHKQGIGVKTTDADFNIIPSTNTQNEFINLYKGVDIQGTMDSSSNIISDNAFAGNVIGVYLNNANSTSVTSNEMDLYSSFDFGGKYKLTGLYVTGSQGLHIEDNDILDSSSLKPNVTVGMFIRDCGNTYDEIYRNYFTDLDTGVHSEGINGGISFLSGLKIICNDFTEVAHDIYVAPLSHIGMIQGSKYETAGNRFMPECSGTYDEFNNNGGQITYYYQNSPVYIPDCNFNVNLFESEVPHDCISRLSSISGFDGAIAGLNSSITTTESALATLTDGGDTEALNETVDEAESSEALQLRNELLSNSPMLSDTVMVNTTVVEDVLPSLMVKEVLAANPQAAKSDKVQTALDNRVNQLPTYMRSEIDLGKNSLSDKETLESQLALAINQREDLINRKMIQLKQEATVETLDTLETLLVNEAVSKLDRAYQLVDFYLSQGDVQNAQTLFTDIPVNLDLTSTEQNSYNKLEQLYAIRFSLENANQSWFEMDSIQKNLVESIAIDSISTAGMQSRAILSLVDNVDYGCYIPDIVSTPKSANATETLEETFKVYPEQAIDYFIVEYVLAEEDKIENVSMAVFDSKGKQVKNFTVKTPANQFLVECENWQEGTYWCRKLVDKSVVSEQKVIINRGSEPNSVQGDTELKLYPNPSSSYFFVSYGNGATDTIVQITDSKGAFVGQLTLKNGQSKIETDSWQQGVYIVSILQNNKVIDTAKIVVE